MIKLLSFLTLLTLATTFQVTAPNAYFPKVRNKVTDVPNKNKVWVYIMAGQSNMAGRGLVSPSDTLENKRIYTIGKNDDLVYAKEPLHYYEPSRTGLDCGVSFATHMLKHVPKNVRILIVPTAVGGSSISQWLGDSLYREVKLYSNFKNKSNIAKQNGIVKGIIWHQGESDANAANASLYKERMNTLFTKMRKDLGNEKLPIVIGELGIFGRDGGWHTKINTAMREYKAHEKNIGMITTTDLFHKGDSLHFDAASYRTMGKRYAEQMVKIK
jgi:hypothetical protein